MQIPQGRLSGKNEKTPIYINDIYLISDSTMTSYEIDTIFGSRNIDVT